MVPDVAQLTKLPQSSAAKYGLASVLKLSPRERGLSQSSATLGGLFPVKKVGRKHCKLH